MLQSVNFMFNQVQVSLLLTWGINNGHEWDYAAAGPLGLTPLHLAALLDDGGKVADELTGVCWLLQKCADMASGFTCSLPTIQKCLGCTGQVVRGKRESTTCETGAVNTNM